MSNDINWGHRGTKYADIRNALLDRAGDDAVGYSIHLEQELSALQASLDKRSAEVERLRNRKRELEAWIAPGTWVGGRHEFASVEAAYVARGVLTELGIEVRNEPQYGDTDRHLRWTKVGHEAVEFPED